MTAHPATSAPLVPGADQDSAYRGLAGGGDANWAFGTGFHDPSAALAGAETVPDGVDPGGLARYCLMLADDALVASHRLSQWCSRAPELEEDVALANIALDLLGQARLLLARAAAADPGLVGAVTDLPAGSPAPAEDALAYFRDADGFRNVRLTEGGDADFAVAIVSLLLLSTWRLALLQRLAGSRDPVLAAVAVKGVSELTYHRDHAGRWFVTLALGTTESRRRLLTALEALWPLWPELFDTDPVTTGMAAVGVAVDPADARAESEEVLDTVFSAAGVNRPMVGRRLGESGRTGREGVHTEALSLLLAEMQVVARAHPTGVW